MPVMQSDTRRGVILATLVGIATLLMTSGPLSSASAAAYEPNDFIAAAAGPLLAGQTYEAGIDTPSDRDFFYFYVTSPGPVSVTFDVHNLGPDASAADIDASLVNGQGTSLDGFAYFLAPGHEATGTTTLEAGKYFLEVVPSAAGSGTTSYTIGGGGGPGAFGPYSEIASRCATGTAAQKRARKALTRAQGKLQRAAARLRQSRFGTREERAQALAHYRRVKALTAAKRHKLKVATGLTQPWCSI